MSIRTLIASLAAASAPAASAAAHAATGHIIQPEAGGGEPIAVLYPSDARAEPIRVGPGAATADSWWFRTAAAARTGCMAS
jgi:hypothetical protein